MKASTKENFLSAINTLIEEDLQIRRSEYKIDCMSELYRDENLLPAYLRITRPLHNSDKTIIIKEKIRAILLGEYAMLYTYANKDFREQRITYKEYLARTNEYTNYANELWI